MSVGAWCDIVQVTIQFSFLVKTNADGRREKRVSGVAGLFKDLLSP